MVRRLDMAYTQDEIKKQMAANSAAWHSADASTKKQLEAANQALGKLIGGTYNSKTGTWSNSSGGSLYGSSSGSSSSSGNKSSGSSYTPLGTYNDAALNSSDAAKVKAYKDQWAAAQKAGDTRAMEAAHAAAEAIRKQYNYSGGGDGSDYIGFPVDEIFNIPSYNYDTSSRPSYTSEYKPQIDDLLNQILTRDKFSYNVEEDPLYAQYKQQYLREGNRAMNDTLASAASNAGGMNSYAVTAAQQANNYYNAQLGDKIPELYQLAYGMYLDDIDNQVRDLGLLNDMDYTQYGRYRDTMGDWENDRDFAYGKYRDDMSDYFNNRDFQYGVSRDEVADSRYDQEWNYNVGRDTVSDNRYNNETAYNKAMEFLSAGVMPSASVLSAAGITAAEAQAYLSRVTAANTLKKGSSSSSSGSSSGGKKSSSSGTSTTSSGTGYQPKSSGNSNVTEINPNDEVSNPSHEIWGGTERDDFYDISRVVRGMYDRNKSDDEIAGYLIDRIADKSINREEAVRIAENYGVKL